MKISTFLASCSLGVLLAIAGSASAKIYKWIDENGVIQYTQYPPPQGRVEEVKPQVAPAPAAPKADSDLQKRAAEADQRRATREQAAEDAEALKANKEKLAADCERLRGNLEVLKRNPRVREKQTDGSMKVLTDEDRAAKVQQYEKQLSDFCTDP